MKTANKHLENKVEALTKQVGEEALKPEKPREANRTTKGSGLPEMNVKLIKKPDEYGGKGWNSWSSTFINFLKRSDPRWKPILELIRINSTKPLDSEDLEEIMDETKIDDPVIFDEFKEQLHEYLKSYTTGDIEAMVMATSPSDRLECWRKLSDEGKCVRPRSLRDERKRLMHPKQVTVGQVLTAIAQWENDLGEYSKVNEAAKFTESDMIMCIEDICPVEMQKYIAEKSDLEKITTYKGIKDLVARYLDDDKRWGRQVRQKTNWCGEVHDHARDYDHDDHGEAQDDQAEEEEWKKDILGEINALVKTKFSKGS